MLDALGLLDEFAITTRALPRFTCVIMEEIPRIARATMVIPSAQSLCNEHTILTITFVWFARRAGVLRATLRVMTVTANGALGRTSDTVSGVGTALVALVIAAGRVVSTVAYHLCARTIAFVPCRA